MNKSFEVHCICGDKTLFKSKWSSRTATDHIKEGYRFSYETCWGDEGFQNYDYRVVDRQDDRRNNLATVRVIRD
jgi:hypothetical protein